MKLKLSNNSQNILIKNIYEKYFSILGEYWIDPNEGDARDAILVYCDAKKRATCLLPNPVHSPEIIHITDQPETWLSEIENGMKVTLFVELT